MVSLERAIYSVAYYWHGINRRGVHGVLWLFDKLHNLELLSWSNVNEFPHNQVVANKIEEMITNNDLCVTNRWKLKFGNSGLEPVQIGNQLEIYKPSGRFSENFRMVIKYYLHNKKDFKTLYNEYENKPMNKQKFLRETHEFLVEKSRID